MFEKNQNKLNTQVKITKINYMFERKKMLYGKKNKLFIYLPIFYSYYRDEI